MVTRTIISFSAVLLLSGCAGLGAYIDRAAEANDTAIDASIFTMCRAASVGSVLRKFDTPEKASIWKDLCLTESQFSLSLGDE
jgi:hypothetical protein